MDWNIEKDGADAGADTGSDALTAFRLAIETGLKSRSGEAIWYSAILDLRETSIDDFEGRIIERYGQGVLVIPDEYDSKERAEVQMDQPVVVFAADGILRALNTEGAEFGVAYVTLGSVVDPADLNPGVRASPPQEVIVPKGTVLMGVIDDGIAIGNDVFRKGPCDSRVHLAYVMKSGGPGGQFTFGQMIEKAQIDQALVDHTHSGLLDEAGFYQKLGIINWASPEFSPVSLRLSHGTHVLSMAAGYRMEEAPETRPILCASLPTRVTQDVTGQDLRPSLALALRVLTRYALRYKFADGTHPPFVLNFSYGNFAESHDGTNPIARLIERALARFPQQEKRLVLAAGNGNLSRIHAKVAFEADQSAPVELRMMAQPDDRTASYVQMWMPWTAQTPAPNFVRVRVTAPDGAQSPWFSAVPGAPLRYRDDEGRVVAQLSYRFRKYPTERGLITFSMNPTASLEAGAALAPAGLWHFEIAREHLAPDQTVDVWIQRDDTLPGFPPHGRQAYFNNACYERFDAIGRPLTVDPPGTACPIRRAGTISGFADGASPLVIGAFVQSNGEMSDYSAAGPITPMRGDPVASREGPDAAARADDSLVLSGVLGAGSASGAMIRQGGTSNASPLAARRVADAMEGGASGDRGWIWNAAQADDVQFPPPPPIPTRGGGGRLNVRFRFEPKDPSV